MGYGNMARKYFRILNKINKNLKIKFYTSQKKANNLFYKKNDLKIFDPDIIFICSSTDNHFKDLLKVNELFKKKIILIEKPIFNKVKKISLKNKVYVAYNLRYDPIINEIKNLIKNKKIWSIEVFCNSFMPRWRRRNYTKTYSAHQKLGGGVALDLSHEIDFLLWFFKNIKIQYCLNNKISDLKISSDDNLVLIGKSKNVKQIILHLNYYSKINSRTINISGKNLDVRANLIEKKIRIEKDNKIINKSWAEKKFHKTFERQLKAVIYGQNIKSATYNEGIKVLKVIEQIRVK